MKQKGIGLSCFRGPFDQIATFPANVHQVNFSSDQVTAEMQGVQVSGMIVWSINRNGDGPFKAYMNLGEDLHTGNPRIANANLVSMSEAIVRTQIAHQTTKQILAEREQLRAKIREEMNDVVKGWGVWLETVEITDVVIKSQPVFKDMQAEYRENVKRVAEAYRLKINSEVADIRMKKDAEMQKKKLEMNADLLKYNQSVAMDSKKATRKHEIAMAVEQRKITEMSYEFTDWQRKLDNEENLERLKENNKKLLREYQTSREGDKVERQINFEQSKQD